MTKYDVYVRYSLPLETPESIFLAYFGLDIGRTLNFKTRGAYPGAPT